MFCYDSFKYVLLAHSESTESRFCEHITRITTETHWEWAKLLYDNNPLKVIRAVMY